MRVLLLFCLAAAAAAAAGPKTLPASWKRCSPRGPNPERCYRDAVMIALQDLSDNGSRELGVLPLDPLSISKVVIEQSQGPVSIDLQFTDLRIYGFKASKLTDDIKASFTKRPLSFSGKAYWPEGITLKGQYKVNGKVLVLPIQGEGECELNLENATALFGIHFHDAMRDGLRFLNVDDFKFTFDTTLLKIRLENLFNGNKELSTHMNTFLNENWKEILVELKPAIQDAFGTAFKVITNRIYSKVPVKNLIIE